MLKNEFEEYKKFFKTFGSQIKFGEKAKVEVYFKNVNMPKIIVNDVHNLIGA